MRALAGAIRNTALLTVEGGRADICALPARRRPVTQGRRPLKSRCGETGRDGEAQVASFALGCHWQILRSRNPNIVRNRDLECLWYFLYCSPHTFYFGDDMGAMIRDAGDLVAHVHVADTINHKGSSGLRYIVNPPVPR
jgi:hypothetical protein